MENKKPNVIFTLRVPCKYDEGNDQWRIGLHKVHKILKNSSVTPLFKNTTKKEIFSAGTPGEYFIYWEHSGRPETFGDITTLDVRKCIRPGEWEVVYTWMSCNYSLPKDKEITQRDEPPSKLDCFGIEDNAQQPVVDYVEVTGEDK